MLKAYTVATEVLGRNADFDPQTDPIVRVEATRLRRALDRYYLAEGRDDPVRITMPRGGYSIVIHGRDEDPEERPLMSLIRYRNDSLIVPKSIGRKCAMLLPYWR